jgi:hypothetical protein
MNQAEALKGITTPAVVRKACAWVNPEDVPALVAAAGLDLSDFRCTEPAAYRVLLVEVTPKAALPWYVRLVRRWAR